jgi:hypothetical protein
MSSFAAHCVMSCLLSAVAIKSGNLSGVQAKTGMPRLEKIVHCHGRKMVHPHHSVQAAQPPARLLGKLCSTLAHAFGTAAFI